MALRTRIGSGTIVFPPAPYIPYAPEVRRHQATVGLGQNQNPAPTAPTQPCHCSSEQPGVLATVNTRWGILNFGLEVYGWIGTLSTLLVSLVRYLAQFGTAAAGSANCLWVHVPTYGSIAWHIHSASRPETPALEDLHTEAPGGAPRNLAQ